MITALTRIAPLMSSDRVDGNFLYAILNACVTDEDHVEHLRVRAVPLSAGVPGSEGVPTVGAYADVLAFLDTSDAHGADEMLARLVRRAIANTPELHLWRVL